MVADELETLVEEFDLNNGTLDNPVYCLIEFKYVKGIWAYFEVYYKATHGNTVIYVPGWTKLTHLWKAGARQPRRWNE